MIQTNCSREARVRLVKRFALFCSLSERVELETNFLLLFSEWAKLELAVAQPVSIARLV